MGYFGHFLGRGVRFYIVLADFFWITDFERISRACATRAANFTHGFAPHISQTVFFGLYQPVDTNYCTMHFLYINYCTSHQTQFPLSLLAEDKEEIQQM